VLDKIKTKGGVLSDITDINTAVTQAADYIVDMNVKADAIERNEASKMREDTRRSVEQEVLTSLLQARDASTVDLVPFQQRLVAAGDTEGVSRLTQLRSVVAGQQFDSKEGIVNSLFSRIVTPGSKVGVREVIAQLNARNINRGDAQNLLQLIQQRENEDAQSAGNKLLRSAYSHPLFQNYHDKLSGVFGSLMGDLQGDKGRRVSAAQAEFNSNWVRHVQENPDVLNNWQAMNQWLQAESERVQTKFRQGQTSGFIPAVNLDQSAEWSKNPVGTREQILRIRQEIISGELSNESETFLRQNGINDLVMMQQFVRLQTTLHDQKVEKIKANKPN
jgi:hypothetical protein